MADHTAVADATPEREPVGLGLIFRRLPRVSIPRPEPRDFFFLGVFVLVAMGVVMVFSASAFHWIAVDDPYYFLRRQLAWLVIATLAGIFCYQVDYRILKRYHRAIYLVVLVLLVAVLIPQLGRNVNASRRWLPLGGGLQVQPSELGKIAVMIFVAGFLDADPARSRRFWKGFVPLSLAVLPVFTLVLIEPDFGTSVFIAVLAFGLIVLGGVPWRYLLASALVFAPILSVFIYVRREQIQARLLGFLEPESVYQVDHSLVALGSGGWAGRGLGAGGQKHQFLPEAHTDFVFSILGEELGFLGAIAVVVLFVVVLWSGTLMVLRFRDTFGFLLGAGITLALSLQAAFNLAVVTASAPTKGIPLPFMTFGGSGLCVTLAQVGILLSIDRVHREEAARG